MSEHPLVCQKIAERTGAQLSNHQRERLELAIAQKIGSRSEVSYVRYLESFEGSAEAAELMSVLSVHKTELFRDLRQLQALEDKVLPYLLAKKNRLEVWSAGCATGEEVATLLILLAEAGAAARSTVLGTDLSQGVIEAAQAFSYGKEMAKGVPAKLLERYFNAVDGRFELVGRLAARATFARHNLIDVPYPLSTYGKFDLIFCRNVLIYFTEAAAMQVLARLAERLNEGGVLVLGAAEPLASPPTLKLWREQHAFFHVKGLPPESAWSTSSSVSLPAVQVIPPLPPEPAAPPPPANQLDQATALFDLALDRASQGEETELTEMRLRKCLNLDPQLAPARYLLAVLLEQRGDKAEAIGEYRRILRSLKPHDPPRVEFFLNPARLVRACEVALDRLSR